MTHYTLVFDAAQVGYRQWTFVAPGVAIFAIGVLLILYRRTHPIAAPSFRERWFPYIYTGFSAFWVVVAFTATFSEYWRVHRALATGRFTVVEGAVIRFVPMPKGGHAMETFEVDGHRFRYSDYAVSAGFNNTTSHGGPIHEGLHVRIAEVDGLIARLEIEK